MDSKYQSPIILCWILVLVAISDIVSYEFVEGLQTMDKSKFRPKPRWTIKTIEIPEDNEVIDCVDIYKQPAFRNKDIKDIQLEPPPGLFPDLNITDYPLDKITEHEECPKGSVPIVRGRHYNHTIHHRSHHRLLSNVRNSHEYAIAGVPPGPRGTYQGANAWFNVWNPRVSGPEEFSLVQIWIVSPVGSRDMNTLEAGLMVNPRLFGDSHTRLFTFWTRDNYGTTHCYNYDCYGFQQTNPHTRIGRKICPHSVYDGNNYEVYIGLAREPATGRWWVRFNNRVLGFFPPGIFTHLRYGADRVRFGGEIINDMEGGRHTKTEMGSGHFPYEGMNKASYIRDMEVLNHAYARVNADITGEIIITHPTCYSLLLGDPTRSPKTYFFYGGPGQSEICR